MKKLNKKVENVSILDEYPNLPVVLGLLLLVCGFIIFGIVLGGLNSNLNF